MLMQLFDGKSIFHNIRTIAPDGNPREYYHSLILGPSEIDNYAYQTILYQGTIELGDLKYRRVDTRNGNILSWTVTHNRDPWTQSVWQAYYLQHEKELPSLPALVGIFVQIRDALYSKDKELQQAAEELRDSLRQDYKGGSLPTSTRVDYRGKTIAHRVGTSFMYVLPFRLPSSFKPNSIGGFYKLEELIEQNEYADALTALFGRNDMYIVRQALTEIINDEPFVIVYNGGMGEIQESCLWTCTDGEVRVDNVWVLRKSHRTARAISLDNIQNASQKTKPLEEKLV